MKLRFNELCRDKHTKCLYEVGSIHEFSEERAKEIIASGKAELVNSISDVKEAVKEAEQRKIKEAEEQEKAKMIDMFSLTKKELVEIAKKVGVSIRGTKEEIIERILVQEVDKKAD